MQEHEQQKIFENWLEKYQGLLFKVVRAYAFSDTDQDDLFQEICLQLWNSIPRFRGESAISTWVYKISFNTAIRWKKSERKHQDSHQHLNHLEHILKENKQHIDDRLVWLYEEIAKLNEIDRSLTLLLLDGFSYKEMGKILGISESNIGVKIHRIKKYLTTKAKIHQSHGI